MAASSSGLNEMAEENVERTAMEDGQVVATNQYQNTTELSVNGEAIRVPTETTPLLNFNLDTQELQNAKNTYRQDNRSYANIAEPTNTKEVPCKLTAILDLKEI